jgi:L-rhamnonate dehydratase
MPIQYKSDVQATSVSSLLSSSFLQYPSSFLPHIHFQVDKMVQAEGVKTFPKIKDVRTFIIQGVGSGGDYHNVKGGHWLIDSKISTPMSGYEQYTKSRTSWGINVLGSFCVEIEATDGTKGFATGFGGPPACWLVAEHFQRFLIGAGE